MGKCLRQFSNIAATNMAAIKELRNKTGAPLSDVKEALESCGYDQSNYQNCQI